MKLTKAQADGFAKIIKKGLDHYCVVPHSLGQFEEPNQSDVIGYVCWKDPEAQFTTESGDTNQEFYIKTDGTVCVYTNGLEVSRVFIPVVFRTKNWKNFCNPKPVGSE